MVRKICEATHFQHEDSGIKHGIFIHVYPWEGSMVRRIELRTHFRREYFGIYYRIFNNVIQVRLIRDNSAKTVTK